MIRATLLGLSFCLAGCTETLTIVAPPEATRAVVARPDTAPDVSLAPSQMTNLNQIRRNAGLAAVTRSTALEGVARAHAEDMQRNRYFSHISRDGSEIGDRVRAGGYQYCVVVENIAQGQGSEARVMRDWMASATHRRNILEQRVTEYGLARTSGNYWALVMAAPGCAGGRQVDWR